MNNIQTIKREIKHRRSVRKTLTIDADIAEDIEKRLQESAGVKEKELVNGLLRIGLNAGSRATREPFVPLSFPGGLRKGITPEKLEELLDEI